MMDMRPLVDNMMMGNLPSNTRPGKAWISSTPYHRVIRSSEVQHSAAGWRLSVAVVTVTGTTSWRPAPHDLRRRRNWGIKVWKKYNVGDEMWRIAGDDSSGPLYTSIAGLSTAGPAVCAAHHLCSCHRIPMKEPPAQRILQPCGTNRLGLMGVPSVAFGNIWNIVIVKPFAGQ